MQKLYILSAGVSGMQPKEKMCKRKERKREREIPNKMQ